MNENQEPSPTEETPSWRDYPEEMTCVKYGLVCVAVFCALLWMTPLLVVCGASDNEFTGSIIFIILVHTIGMICCFRCPKTVVKWRMWLVGGSVLLFITGILGIVIALQTKYSYPFAQLQEMAGWLSFLLLYGFLPWLFFLVKLAQGIHARKCTWLAKTIFIIASISPLVVLIANMTRIEPPEMWNVWFMFHMFFMLVAYPLLIVSLWWRIHTASPPEAKTTR